MLLWWLWLERYCLWAVKMLASPSHLDINDLYAWHNYLQLSCFLSFPKGAETAVLQLTNPVNIFQTEVVRWAGDFISVYTSASFGISPKASKNTCVLNEECQAFIPVVWLNFETANFLRCSDCFHLVGALRTTPQTESVPCVLCLYTEQKVELSNFQFLCYSNINKPDSCKKLFWIQLLLWLRQSKGAWSFSDMGFSAIINSTRICTCRIDSEKVCVKSLTVTWYSCTKNVSQNLL